MLCYALRSAVAWPSLAYRYNRYAIIHMIDKAEAAVGWKSIELRSSSPSSPSPTFSYSIFVPARSKGLLSSNATTEKTIPNNFSLFSFSLSALVVASRTDMFVRMSIGIQWALVYIIPIRKSVYWTWYAQVDFLSPQNLRSNPFLPYLHSKLRNSKNFRSFFSETVTRAWEGEQNLWSNFFEFRDTNTRLISVDEMGGGAKWWGVPFRLLSVWLRNWKAWGKSKRSY